MSALLAIQQWSGATQFVARVVPEGLDDVELIGQERILRLQIKSRHDPQAAFSHKEVAEYLVKAARNLTPDEWAEDRVSIGLVLERPVDEQGSSGWTEPLAARVDLGLQAALHDALGPSSTVSVEQVLARTLLIVEEEPIDRRVDLLVARSGVLPFVARLIAHDLRIQAGSCADANFRRTAQNAAELDASIVETTRARLLLAVDPSGIDEAIRTGGCEPVDFGTELHRDDFYDGVNVVPEHVAAGLVFKRQTLVDAVLDAALGRFRPVVIAGPSGSGKSALAWLAAHESRHVVRWHDVRHLDSSHVATFRGWSRPWKRPMRGLLASCSTTSGAGLPISGSPSSSN